MKGGIIVVALLWLLSQSGHARAAERPAPHEPTAPPPRPAPRPAPAPRARLTTRDNVNVGVRAQSGADALRIATKAVQDAARAAGLDPTTALPHPLEVREASAGHYQCKGALELVTPAGEPATDAQVSSFRRALGGVANVVVR